ncbi:MAG: hypothetical protein JWO98_5063 [Frankiales bacterium]|nr:hypothetical protein [Frankiales bacterium]
MRDHRWRRGSGGADERAGSGPARPRLPGPLHTEGRWIVDQNGRRVKLASVNWSGAETQAFVVGGLDTRPLDELAALIADGGFNSVRLPWSNQLVEDDPVVPAEYLAANPDLQGSRALDVLDEVVAALGRHGLMVVLDNHRSRADWCCDWIHGDGLWYSPEYPEAAWLADWRTMAARYRLAGNVVAAELRNEIRHEPQLRPGPTEATWGDDHPLTDWRAAAQRGGNAVLGANPDLLVIVGGREFQTNLRGALSHPVRLEVPGRLVYAAHDYRWYHSALGHYPFFAFNLWFRFGYVRTPGHPFTAPLYLSETGTCTNPHAGERCHQHDERFLRHMTRYLAHTDIDFAYWPFNGTQGTGYSRTYGDAETYGLVAPDWSGYGNQAVLSALRPLRLPTRGPRVGRRR